MPNPEPLGRAYRYGGTLLASIGEEAQEWGDANPAMVPFSTAAQGLGAAAEWYGGDLRDMSDAEAGVDAGLTIFGGPLAKGAGAVVAKAAPWLAASSAVGSVAALGAYATRKTRALRKNAEQYIEGFHMNPAEWFEPTSPLGTSSGANIDLTTLLRERLKSATGDPVNVRGFSATPDFENYNKSTFKGDAPIEVTGHSTHFENPVEDAIRGDAPNNIMYGQAKLKNSFGTPNKPLTHKQYEELVANGQLARLEAAGFDGITYRSTHSQNLGEVVIVPFDKHRGFKVDEVALDSENIEDAVGISENRLRNAELEIDDLKEERHWEGELDSYKEQRLEDLEAEVGALEDKTQEFGLLKEMAPQLEDDFVKGQKQVGYFDGAMDQFNAIRALLSGD